MNEWNIQVVVNPFRLNNKIHWITEHWHGVVVGNMGCYRDRWRVGSLGARWGWWGWCAGAAASAAGERLWDRLGWAVQRPRWPAGRRCSFRTSESAAPADRYTIRSATGRPPSPSPPPPRPPQHLCKNSKFLNYSIQFSGFQHARHYNYKHVHQLINSVKSKSINCLF